MTGAIILSRIDVVKSGLEKIWRWGVGLAAARLLGIEAIVGGELLGIEPIIKR